MIAQLSLSVLLALPLVPLQEGWPPEVQAALQHAGSAQEAWLDCFDQVPLELRADLGHLITAMPAADLATLSPARVLGEVELAVKVRAQVPWGAALPDALFREYVLPYAHVSEARDPWRQELTDLCLPMVADCKTPAEAAQRLNERLFKQVGVIYSTKRKRPDQSPLESMDLGLASCTGLSILLADACRAICIPARLAGTASWAEKPGNHTWVEIWDQGWHFTGACEPDARGLNHGWFEGDAARAIKGDPLKAIFAVSWSSGKAFPMAWAPDRMVGGVDVTNRYLQDEVKPKLDDRHARLLITLRDIPGGERIEVPIAVTLVDDNRARVEGLTRGESADTNDVFECVVLRGKKYFIQVEDSPGSWSFPWFIETPRDQGVVHYSNNLWSKEGFSASGNPTEIVAQWFSDVERDPNASFPEGAFRGRSTEGVRGCIEQAWLQSTVTQQMRADALGRKVRINGQEAIYTLRAVGERPTGGWPVVIAMHGGGGVPKEVNDSQWKMMQSYYKDHPEVTGYLYLALRAPNDEWNGFYDDRIALLVNRLVAQLIATEGADPDRVHLIGYSHGGYGAFVIGTKIPWRFAAVHASAAGPTGGETIGLNLANTRFTFMVGEKDTAYGRIDVCREFAASMKQLQGTYKGLYDVEFLEKAGYGHGGLPDRDYLTQMLTRVRQPVPRELHWRMSDDVLKDFAWISVEKPVEGAEVHISCKDNRVEISGQGVDGVWVYLDDRLVDPDEAIILVVGDEEDEVYLEMEPESMARRMRAFGDPSLMFSAGFWVDLP